MTIKQNNSKPTGKATSTPMNKLSAKSKATKGSDRKPSASSAKKPSASGTRQKKFGSYPTSSGIERHFAKNKKRLNPTKRAKSHSNDMKANERRFNEKSGTGKNLMDHDGRSVYQKEYDSSYRAENPGKFNLPKKVDNDLLKSERLQTKKRTIAHNLRQPIHRKSGELRPKKNPYPMAQAKKEQLTPMEQNFDDHNNRWYKKHGTTAKMRFENEEGTGNNLRSSAKDYAYNPTRTKQQAIRNITSNPKLKNPSKLSNSPSKKRNK